MSRRENLMIYTRYRANWQDENKALYEWDDLDGPRPTMDEYEKQEKEARE